MNLLITICARGGSKGIPGKNIRELNGTPLIGYTIQCAQKFASMHGSDIALSTDSPEIRETAAQFGLFTDYERPPELANDTAGKIGVIRHLLEHQEDTNDKPYDFVLDLDVTSPLRTQNDLETAFSRLQNIEEALNIFSVNPAARNPYFNMVERGADGFVHLVKDSTGFGSRQQAPPVYDMNASFYIYRRRFFSEGHQSSISPKSLAHLMDHVCFDLDHPADFTVMEIMMRENLLGFEL
jgi:CMP-N,N'-diacetyllegionaminic acid synthase